MSTTALSFVLDAAKQSQLQQCLEAGAVGLLAHSLYFIHWSQDTAALKVAVGHVVALTALLSAEIFAHGLKEGLLAGLANFAAYLAALFTSIIVYRIFFHRLRHFPGPLGGRCSKLYGFNLTLGGKAHEEYDALLNHYGEFVRLAFEAREEPIRSTIQQWLAKVDELKGQPVDFCLFASLMSFDITGRVGFSVDFGGVKAGKRDPLQTYIRALFKSLSSGGQLPWVISLFVRLGLPLSQDVVQFDALTVKLVSQRLEDTEVKEDIVGHFIEDFRSEKPKAFFTREHIECDAQAILVGAADSSFSPITFCMAHLVTHPESMQKLRRELAPLFNTTHPGGFAHADLAHAEYLDAVLNETMRLHNPTCANGPKKTPPEGIVLSDTFIPGGVSLVSSIWSFHRSAKFFARPLEWIPERWTTASELVLDKRAFHPFSIGPFNCVGQRMAMMTIRMVIAYTVWFCDPELAPGEDGTAVFTQSLNELFLVPGPLHLVFRKRSEYEV
ncbi:hypothetical protein G7046_g10009 [Stylonectria norvegica]|nr:hypothetical protein G7046_g10009 [Stylonectria norvegica]